jgi:hypothetical protein
MKRSRGRPKGKTYPPPEDFFMALSNTVYGKIGASQAVRLVLLCLDADFADLVPSPKKTSSKKHRPSRREAQINKWKREIGTVVWQRILTCDDEFFRQLAEVLETMFKADQPREGFSPRFLALVYKEYCHRERRPFKEKVLRAICEGYNYQIDPSTLSKVYRWAKGAEWHGLPTTLAPLIMQQAPTSYIHPLCRPLH